MNTGVIASLVCKGTLILTKRRDGDRSRRRGEVRGEDEALMKKEEIAECTDTLAI